MITVVNPNVGLDYMLFFEGFRKDATMRATRAKWGLGGKGLVAAYLLAGLGVPVWVTGFSGGIVGEGVRMILDSRGAVTDFVEVKGTARINVVLKDLSGGWQSTVTAPGLRVERKDEQELVSRVRQRLSQTSCLILGGSLPPGCSTNLYKKLIETVVKEDVPCVLDTSGEPLREAVRARPTAIKPNCHEAQELLGKEIADEEDALAAAEEFGRMGIAWAVITLGAGGLVAFGDGRAWYAPPPPLTPKSTAGAGDAVVAGLALGLANRFPLQEAVRWGLAIAAAVMDKWSVLDCQPGEVEHWKQKIEIVQRKTKKNRA